jgi:peptidoglycan hydrolase-like protein with peptidoglycan-binding domain
MFSNAKGAMRFVSLKLGNAEITKTPSIPGDAGQLPTIEYVQQVLVELGFDPGLVDGKMGRKTRQAILDFQRANGLVADGRITRELGTTLRKLVAAKKAETRRAQEIEPAEENTEGLGTLE